MENIESENKSDILSMLDSLRERVERNEILQLFVALEDAEGFDCMWSGSEDTFAVSGFVIGAALTRMGFARQPGD